MPDIDIDFFDRSKALAHLEHHVAMRDQKRQSVKHNTGIYFQSIPHNPFTNIATIDYKAAEDRGYFKIDFLNVSMYEGVRDEAHLIQLLDIEPLWHLLEHEEVVTELFHIGEHHQILKKLKPTSIEELAAVLAIIRPAKRYLVDRDWKTIMDEVWVRPEEDLYFFKRSHAIAYAAAIVVQLNLICENLTLSFTD
jgi:DNA polymerase III alpha subunit